MLLTRFWYVVLAALAAASIAAGLLAQTAFNRQHDAMLADQLTRDRREIELVLRADARTRLDAIAPIAAHADVRALLTTASPPTDLLRRVGATVNTLNGQLGEMRGNLLHLVDTTGRIAAAGVEPAGHALRANTPGTGLGEFPVVKRALAGYVRDDVWVYNAAVYRIAARPVIDGGHYVGAIVHGMRVDNGLAQRLGRMLDGAGIVFFRGDHLLASYFPPVEAATTGVLPEPPRDALAQRLPEVLRDAHLREGKSTDAIELTPTARAVFSLVTGSAAHADVGYAIVRPVKHLASAAEVFEVITDADVGRLPWPILIVSFLAAVAVGMFFLWLERDRPIRRLRSAASAVAEGRIERVSLADVGGVYRNLAADLNRAIEKTAEQVGPDGTRRKSANLDEILGPAPEAQAATPFFSFGATSSHSGTPAPAAASARANASGGAGASSGGAAAGTKTQSARPSAGAASSPGAPARRPVHPQPPAATKQGDGVGSPADGAGTAAAASAANAATSSTPPTNGPSDPPKRTGATPSQRPADASGHKPFEDDEEIATTIADIPDELLAKSGESDRDSEQRAFREVYDQFIATRKTCGESVQGLTFEKFLRTLERNRDQILSKHAGSSVHFAVYVKDGKAALRATPIK